jgi:hypothetical protein
VAFEDIDERGQDLLLGARCSGAQRALSGGVPDGAQELAVACRVEDGLLLRVGSGPCGGGGQDVGDRAAADEVVGGGLLGRRAARSGLSPEVRGVERFAGGLGEDGGREPAHGRGAGPGAVEPGPAGSQMQGGLASGFQAGVEGPDEITGRPPGCPEGGGQGLVRGGRGRRPGVRRRRVAEGHHARTLRQISCVGREFSAFLALAAKFSTFSPVPPAAASSAAVCW